MFIFIALAYGTAIPIVYFIALIQFHLAYMMESVTLIKYHSRSRLFSEELPQISMDLVKYAVITNLIASCLTLFWGRIYHPAPLAYTHLNEAVLDQDNSFLSIIRNPHGIILLAVILLLLTLYLIAMRE